MGKLLRESLRTWVQIPRTHRKLKCGSVTYNPNVGVQAEQAKLAEEQAPDSGEDPISENKWQKNIEEDFTVSIRIISPGGGGTCF